MVRVLHVLGGLGTGGTESLIMNWYRSIDRTKIQFDFLVRSSDNNYTVEILEMGGRIFYTSSFPRHFIKNYIETKRILEQKEWDVIHVHGNAAMYILPLKLAKTIGYPCRIMHSHNVQAQTTIFSLVHLMNRKKIIPYTTYRLACSNAAGKWMFGKNEFQISKNAVDVSDFKYNKEARTKFRKEYDLENKFVLGHVGRFSTQKNHMFLLEIFKSLLKKKPESILMLVGDGELAETIKLQADILGIHEYVIFLGRRNDIGKVMSAMDMFVLPSLYEGLGNVLVEAQLNGLRCIVSEEAYNKEVQLFPTLSKVSLRKDVDAWVKHILEETEKVANREISDEILADTGYDMKREIIQLEKIYLQEKE